MKARKGMVRYIAAKGGRATRYGVPVGAGSVTRQADPQGQKVGNPPQWSSPKHLGGPCSKVRLAQAVETN